MNTTQHEEKRSAGRPRKEQRRRKQRDGGDVVGKRLAVNKSQLDFDRFVYRWINDDPARIYGKTKEDDWDIVKNNGGIVKDDSADIGDAVSQVVGSKPDGSPKVAYLCRKPVQFYDDDQWLKQADLDEQLSQLRRGMSRDGGANSDYVPSSGISL